MTLIVGSILAVLTLVFVIHPFFKKWPGSGNSEEKSGLPPEADVEAEIERQVRELRKSKANHCPQCGLVFEEDDSFCSQCGMSLSKLGKRKIN